MWLHLTILSLPNEYLLHLFIMVNFTRIISSSSAGHIFIRDFIVTVSADALAPDSARPSTE